MGVPVRLLLVRRHVEEVHAHGRHQHPARRRRDGSTGRLTLVVDCFHIVQLAQRHLADLRRRLTWRHHGRRAARATPSTPSATSCAATRKTSPARFRSASWRTGGFPRRWRRRP
ncbi:hypothetical protein FCI23_17625 [Actinacidiphila oryziradicis]|uniref:Transposase IS204/IS1001/IS1096/IS1165 DDE domain-containing protein n=1 Tax=Actinacidiphila oryziradicis TaxID=2571141 RepID=A0A4U0SKJ8_9ACTN|nr:hypothetical protein FCI23_17625 [Actinacidiphila oryziradicis]